MLETKDLILDKAEFSDWEAMYRNVWSHPECARYMLWNLTESDYVLHLEKGTAANYGLRVSAKAPQVATGIDEALVDAQGETKKVLINNQVFIIRGEKVYTIDGQMVK